MSKKKKRKAEQLQQANNPKTENKRESFSSTPFVFRNHRIPLLLIASLAIGLYFQSVKFDYVLDDKMVIVDNKFTQRGIDGIADIFKYESFRGYFGEQLQLLEGDRYRPLSIATFAVEKSLFGGNKAVSHFINVLLYALTGLLLYRVLFFLFPSRPEEEKPKWYFTVPFIATLLYIAHPLHVEVTANIKGRDEIIALLGELGTLYFSFKYLATKKNRNLLWSFLSFCIAILSKEGAITFLAAVPLTAHFFSKATVWEKFKITLPVLAGTILYLAMRENAIGYLLDDKEVTDVMNNPFYGMSGGDKTATIFYTLLLYLKLHIFPDPLTHDYYPYHIPVMHWSSWQSLLSLALHIGLVVVIIKGWKKKSVWAWAAAFYLVTFSIVSNLFVSVGTFMNERFAYHASLAFCVALAWLLTKTMGLNNRLKLAALALSFVFIAGFSVRTIMRLPDWKTNLTLDASAIKYSPNSARSNCFYGVDIWQNVYMKLPPDADSLRRVAVLDSMKPYFDRSAEILPTYQAVQTMRAGVAAEYHKINMDYGQLISVFEGIERNGIFDKFITDYLLYANSRVTKTSDVEKLKAFYSRIIDFLQRNYPDQPGVTQQFRNLLNDLQSRFIG